MLPEDLLVGQNVKRLAGMHLIPQKELAEQVGVTRQTVNNLFQGKSSASLKTNKAFAAFFGVGIDALLSQPHDCLRKAVDSFETCPARLYGLSDNKTDTESTE